MQLTREQETTLKAIAVFGGAKREWRSHFAYDWRWIVDGRPKSAHVESLWKFGLLHIDGDRASLTDLGRQYLDERKAA